MLTRPNDSEFAPFMKLYIDTVGDNVMEELTKQREELCSYIDGLSEEQLNYKYAEDKWTIKEVLLHLIDTERIFAYRALAICRGDKTNLPGFDQDVYMSNVSVDHMDKEYLYNFFNITRYSSLVMYKGFKDSDWATVGKASNNDISLRSFPYFMAGHVNHHFNIIKERYVIS